MKGNALERVNELLGKYQHFIHKINYDCKHEDLFGGIDLERGEVIAYYISFIPMYGFPVVGDLTLSPDDLIDDDRYEKLKDYLEAVANLMRG